MIHKIQLHFFYQMHNMQDGKSTKFMNTDYMCDIYILLSCEKTCEKIHN